MEIETQNMIDLTGHEQHDFKKCKKQGKRGVVILSIISRMIDNNIHVVMVSVNLWLVNVKHLVEHL
jgi:hypothetical protein